MEGDFSYSCIGKTPKVCCKYASICSIYIRNVYICTRPNRIKKMKKVLFALAALIALAACENKQKTVSSTENGNDSSEVDVVLSDENEGTYFPAIDQFLAEEIGSQYAKGEFCVPFHSIVGVDERNSEDILVWGDFWVFNYNTAGDTLKTASGGSHPGLFHLRKVDNGYEVTAFDQVGDGSEFEPTAKSIFGDKYEAFMKMHSNDKEREQNRAQGIAKYAKANGLKVTMYQDEGWPAVKLPE